ncbi:MAG: EAL domain-containing protein [Thiomicrospira sp.]|jgi:EAL domain-containing protein (putative c-di-GMP-specific phosphodiesterase class I)|nr:EAL domain-containing protein [Thiomicrospira sp.]
MATYFPIEDIMTGCGKCHAELGFDFTFAFQPIVDMEKRDIFGYEALVRGANQDSAWSVLQQVNDQNRYAFDQACRVKAIELASQLKLDRMLSINFLPNAVYEPAHCIRSTLDAAKRFEFPTERIMFEITESEQVADVKHLTKIFEYYQAQGFTTALDDFGAGHAGLNMLASFVPHLLKIDMELVRDIDKNSVKQVIVESLIQMCKKLRVRVLAEGLETREEVEYFRSLGVTLMQGYYFAKPGFECLPQVDMRCF